MRQDRLVRARRAKIGRAAKCISEIKEEAKTDCWVRSDVKAQINDIVQRMF